MVLPSETVKADCVCAIVEVGSIGVIVVVGHSLLLKLNSFEIGVHGDGLSLKGINIIYMLIADTPILLTHDI